MQKALLFLFVTAGLALGTTLLLTNSDSSNSTASSPDEQVDLKYASMHLTKMRFEPPMELDFAGEMVPMDLPEVREKLQKELNQKIQHTSGTHQLYRRVIRYQHLITSILEDHDIPTDFFYLSMAESALSNAISPVGAAGFWQFMPETGRAHGLTINDHVDERFDPVKSTYAAVRYLKELYEQHQSWTLVAAAYNMGSTGLARQIEQQGSSDYYSLDLNRETSQYLYRILSNKCIVEQPARYGFDLNAVRAYTPIHYRYVKVTDDTPELSTFAAEQGLTLDQLLTVNPWIMRPVVAPGQTLRLRIPLNKDFFAAELKVRDWRQTADDDPESEVETDPQTASNDSIHRVTAS